MVLEIVVLELEVLEDIWETVMAVALDPVSFLVGGHDRARL
ncbi:hypothetical protein ACHMW5_26660 [Azospirillum melinis]